MGDDPTATTEGIKDTRLYARAIRERWPIPESIKPKIIKRLVKVIDDDAWTDAERPGHREVISATRALLSAEKINLDQQRLDLLREKMHGTEEGTVKAAMDLDDAEAALDEHKPAEKPE